MTIALQALSLVEKVEPVQVRFRLRLRDHRSKWMRDGCKVDVDLYVASSRPCFMVTWTSLNNHLLDVGLTQNWEITALRILKIVGLKWFIMCEDHAWIRKSIDISSSWGHGHGWLHTTLEGPWVHYASLKVSRDGLLTLVLGSHNFMVTTLGLCVKRPPWGPLTSVQRLSQYTSTTV